MISTTSPVRKIQEYDSRDVVTAMMKCGMSTPLPRMTSAKIKYYRKNLRNLLGTFNRPDLEKILFYLKEHTVEITKSNSSKSN